MYKRTPDIIDITNITGTKDSAGVFVPVKSTISNVICSFQYNNRQMKTSINGKDVIVKGIIFVIDETEIDRLIDVNEQSEIIFKSKTYKILQIYRLQKHVQIYF